MGGIEYIGMKDNFFSREVTRVPLGAEIAFENQGVNPHNAIAADGSWSTEEVTGDLSMETGEEASLDIDEPGVYVFFCSFHGTAGGQGMAATLVVGDVAYDPSGGEEPQEAVAEATGTTIEVPADAATIQEGVDLAAPGDLVLISPGVYEEEVLVTTPSLTIRGTDRNEVILDGNFEYPNGFQVVVDGVAIENLTARNYLLNGFFWTGVEGYRASYLTAYNNADYGLYVFDSKDGIMEHSYASGSPDAGFYIGQCYPCDSVIVDVIAENNALGYNGTNAGGDLYIVNSIFRNNMGGVVPNTLDTELYPPQRETTIAGNLISDNNNLNVPYKKRLYATAYGNGIVITGGVDNLVEDNRIVSHENNGVLVVPNLDKQVWLSSGNEVRNNDISNSGVADLTLAGPSGTGNCFHGNDIDRTSPPGLQPFAGCDGLRLPLGSDVIPTLRIAGYAADVSGSEVDLVALTAAGPIPPPQEQMPGGAAAPVEPAVDVFAEYDMPEISIPDDPDRVVAIPKEVLVAGIPLAASSGWQLIFSLYGYLLPFVLYAAWVSLSFWDIARRDDMARRASLLWIAAILLVPFLGVIAYLFLGRSRIETWLRVAVVAGGIGAYGVILVLGALLGGLA